MRRSTRFTRTQRLANPYKQAAAGADSEEPVCSTEPSQPPLVPEPERSKAMRVMNPHAQPPPPAYTHTHTCTLTHTPLGKTHKHCECHLD